MKLKSKNLVHLDHLVPVYDIEVSSRCHNFILGNGVVVHNSKDISDGVTGAIHSCYLDLDHASQLSSKYKAETHGKVILERSNSDIDKIQNMLQGIF